MSFAKYAKDNDKEIVVLNNGRKYSVLYYYGDKITYLSTDDKDQMMKEGSKIFGRETVIIIRNKELEEFAKMYRTNIIEQGRKFSLVRIL